MQQDSRHPYKPDPYRAVRKPPSPGKIKLLLFFKKKLLILFKMVIMNHQALLQNKYTQDLLQKVALLVYL